MLWRKIDFLCLTHKRERKEAKNDTSYAHQPATTTSTTVVLRRVTSAENEVISPPYHTLFFFLPDVTFIKFRWQCHAIDRKLSLPFPLFFLSKSTTTAENKKQLLSNSLYHPLNFFWKAQESHIQNSLQLEPLLVFFSSFLQESEDSNKEGGAAQDDV